MFLWDLQWVHGCGGEKTCVHRSPLVLGIHKPWCFLLAFRIILCVTTFTRKLLTFLCPGKLSECSLIVNETPLSEEVSSDHICLDLLSCALQIISYIKYFSIIVTVKYSFPGQASHCQCRLMESHGCRPHARWVLSTGASLLYYSCFPEIINSYD